MPIPSLLFRIKSKRFHLQSTLFQKVLQRANQSYCIFKFLPISVILYKTALNLNVLYIFLKDTQTGELTIASTSSTGVSGNGDCNFDPSISADGR